MLTLLAETKILFDSERVVRLSSPNLNFLIILGAALMYAAVLFFVYESTSLDGASAQTVLCNVSQLAVTQNHRIKHTSLFLV